METCRWLGVGRSCAREADNAGRDAVRQAVAGRDAKLLIVFASERYDLPALVATIADGAPGAALIGCSTAGEIARVRGMGGFHNQTLVVLAVA